MMEEMKGYRNCIFDLYGTLVDIRTDEYSPSFWKNCAILFNDNGAVYDYRELKDAYFETIRQQEEERKQTGHHIEIDLYDVFAELYRKKDIRANRELIEKTAEEFRGLSLRRLRLYAGAKELLTALRKKGIGVYLLSNAQTLFTVKELKDLGIHDLFDAIFISSACGYKKPDPCFLKQLTGSFSLCIDECLLIGNDLHSDIQMANAAGMDSYYIRSRISSEEDPSIVPTYSQHTMNLHMLKKILNV